MVQLEKQQQEENLRNFNKDTRYVYFGRNKENNNHGGIVCVGYRVDDSGTVLRLSVAFCSPEDVFVKKESHERILARMDKGAFEDLVKDIEEISADNPLFSDMKYEEIIDIIVTALNSAIPADWADYKSYLNNKKPYPKFARIKLPWWLANVRMAA